MPNSPDLPYPSTPVNHARLLMDCASDRRERPHLGRWAQQPRRSPTRLWKEAGRVSGVGTGCEDATGLPRRSPQPLPGWPQRGPGGDHDIAHSDRFSRTPRPRSLFRVRNNEQCRNLTKPQVGASLGTMGRSDRLISCQAPKGHIIGPQRNGRN